MRYFCFFVLFVWVSIIQAEVNSNQPIRIKADRVDVDEQKGSSRYRGNVSIQQGDMEMHADELTVYIVDGKVDRLLAVGRPVKLARKTPQNTRAEANSMEYLAADGKVIIVGKVHLWQGLRESFGNKFEYAIDKDQISAIGGVNVILHPNESKNNLQIKPKKATPDNRQKKK